MRKLIAGTAMAAMLAGSSIAQAAPVAVEDVRADSSVSDVEQMFGGSTLLLGLIAAAVLAVIVWQVADDGEPASA